MLLVLDQIEFPRSTEQIEARSLHNLLSLPSVSLKQLHEDTINTPQTSSHGPSQDRIVFNKLSGGQEAGCSTNSPGPPSTQLLYSDSLPRVNKHPLDKLTGLDNVSVF